MPSPNAQRQFSVYARLGDSQHARTVSERSFEAAAVAYLEDLHPAGEDTEVNIIVRELETGHEHCFRIDLETGEAAACG